MKKWKKQWKVIALAGALALLLAGCGSHGGSGKYYEAAAADTAAAPQENSGSAGGAYLSDGVSREEIAEEAGEADAGGEGSGSSAPQVQDTARKLIRNVDLEVETESFDDLLVEVRRKTDQTGGYIEESYTYNGSSYQGNRLRNAHLTLRIPADHLEEFLSDMAQVSNVISRNESVTEVTLQYVDMESHKKVLLTEQERLLSLLEKAETIEDIITLESRLSEVRYQLESMEAQLRVMDNQVSYSTVYLYIDEVAKLTPVKEQSTWEKISTGFANSLYDVGDGFADFGIGLLIDLPYIVVWALILLVIFFLARLILRRILKKRWIKKEKGSTAFFRKKEKNVSDTAGSAEAESNKRTDKAQEI